MIKVRAIGAAEVQIGRRRITAKTEVVLALAVYLCVRAGERLSRDEVVEVFWPEADATKGRHNLRQLLYRLRQRGFVLDEEGEELWLDPGRVESDFGRILNESWDRDSTADEFPRSTAFLPGLRSPRLSRVMQWRDEVQSHINNLARRAALRHLSEARHEGRWTDAAAWSDRILKIDPLNEEATLSKAESIALQGSKAAAIELLDSYVHDLGQAATRVALPASMLRKRIWEKQKDWGVRHASELPLIGRAPLVSSLTDRLEKASLGKGSTTILHGPPGVGKTRLAHELRDIAGLRGFRVVDIQVDSSASLRPYAAAIQLAHALIDIPGSAGASPDAVAILRTLTCEDRSGGPTVPLGAPRLPDGHLEWAFIEVLTALCTETRLLVCIDDAHHMDASSWSSVHALACATAALRAMLLMTSRKARLHAETQEISHICSRVPVPALSSADSRALALLHAQFLRVDLSPSLADTIAHEAHGNPLFTRELTTARLNRRSPAKLPASLAAIIEERLEHLNARQTRIIRSVALLGPLASISRIRSLARGQEIEVLDDMENLEAEGILTLSSDGKLALHDCWRHSVSERMAPVARASLSLELAELLVAESPHTDATDRAWGAAGLFVAAGRFDSAFECFAEAGDRLLARGLCLQATEAYRQAASLPYRPAGTDIDDRLARALSLSGQVRESIQVSRAAIERLKPYQPDFSTLHIKHLASLADSLWRAGEEFHDELEALAVAVGASGVPATVIHYAALIGLRLVFINADSPRACPFVDAIQRTSSLEGATTYGELARLIWAAEKGDEVEVRAASQSLAQTVSAADPPYVHALALRYRATALRWIGEHGVAELLAKEGATLARSAGSLEEARNCFAFLAFMALDNDEPVRARNWIDSLAEWETLDSSLFQARQLRHARSRLHIQMGEFENCYRLLAPFAEEFQADCLARRRVGETACLSLAAAMTGVLSCASQMIQATKAVLASDTPCAQLDMPAEYTLRALAALGLNEEAARLASEYLERRGRVYRRALPVAGRELARFAAGRQGLEAAEA